MDIAYLDFSMTPLKMIGLGGCIFAYLCIENLCTENIYLCIENIIAISK